MYDRDLHFLGITFKKTAWNHFNLIEINIILKYRLCTLNNS